MKRLLAALILVFAAASPAVGAELGEYLRQIDLYNQMLTELKATDDFARLGFDPSNREATEWLFGAEKLRDEIAKQKFPYQVAEAPQVMIDLAKAYAAARENGFKDAEALDEYEELICRSRIRISDAIHFTGQ